ncbi:glycosyltransferase family 4 protein [Clostridium baratii]|uniref:glycosyltransferase family 4 protein n=1 Tax=Clostridium baratii TaxID=1561 RepID=UPI0030D07E2E
MNLLCISLGREYGGTEIVVQNLIDNLDEYKITVVCLKNSRFSEVLKNKYKDKEKKVKIIGLENNKFAVLKNIKKLKKILNKEKFDVVHVHSIVSNLFFQLANHKKKLPSIITVHSRSDFDRKKSLKGNILNKLELILLNRNSAVVSVSNSIKEYLIEKNIKKSITVIHNGSRDLKKYMNDSCLKNFKNKYFKEEDLIIGFVGRLTEVKGIYNLVDIVNLSNKINKKIKFIVIGEGILRDYIEEQVELNKLENIKLLGFKNDIENYIPYFDMLIMPSNMEGIPLTILEAMSCGVPCVGSDVGGIPEIINEKIGFLYNNSDKKELVLKLDFIEKNRYKLNTLKENCLKEFSTKWNMESVIKKYINQYEKIKSYKE